MDLTLRENFARLHGFCPVRRGHSLSTLFSPSISSEHLFLMSFRSIELVLDSRACGLVAGGVDFSMPPLFCRSSVHSYALRQSPVWTSRQPFSRFFRPPAAPLPTKCLWFGKISLLFFPIRLPKGTFPPRVHSFLPPSFSSFSSLCEAFRGIWLIPQGAELDAFLRSSAKHFFHPFSFPL